MKAIVVPLSGESQRLLDLNVAAPSDLCEEVLTHEEFTSLWNAGVFNEINTLCDTWIDDYEDASIGGAERLASLIRSLESLKQSGVDLPSTGVEKLLKLAALANERNTAIYFFF